MWELMKAYRTIRLRVNAALSKIQIKKKVLLTVDEDEHIKNGKMGIIRRRLGV